MQFSFEVDPDLDMAIGLEADFASGQSDGADLYAEGGPLQPTEAKPGSEDKVRMLSARDAAGVPLWHDADCYDHGPGEVNAFDDADVGLDDEDD